MTDEERKERNREKQRRWIARHKEYQKEWYEKNKERVSENSKRWYEENKDRRHETQRQWEKTHKELRRKSKRRCMYNYLDTKQFKWEDVEGYDGFTTNTDVHHRLEALGFSVADLKARGWYYNRKPDELICLTHGEHRRIHCRINSLLKNKLTEG